MESQDDRLYRISNVSSGADSDGDVATIASRGCLGTLAMTLTWTGWLALAAGSGVAAGITNQLLSWLRDHMQRSFQRDQYTRELEHQKLMLQDQRRHEALLRAEQAHYKARPSFMPHAQNVHAWLYKEWAVRCGREFAYTAKVESPVALRGPDDVLAELDEIAVAHPTRSVRLLARELDGQFETCYNVVAADQETGPTEEQLVSWISAATRLIEAIHEFALDEGKSSAIEGAK
jgi:hypothetical protein